MEPGKRMAELFPEDTIAWIVPNTPIIDAANTDIADFTKHFRCQYWLYATVSRDGSFPVVKTDYLERYCRDAVERGNGLMPQSALTANVFNLQYVTEAGWYGPADSDAFVARMVDIFFAGAPAAKDALAFYTKVTDRYRNWTNNLHTRKVEISREEFELLQKAHAGFIQAYAQAPTALVKDRIRDYAIAALRACKRYKQWNPVERLDQWGHVQNIMGTRPIDSGHDFYGQVMAEERAETLAMVESTN